MGGWNSKKVRALVGRMMALMPNPTKIVAKTLAAMRRDEDWEKAAEAIVAMIVCLSWFGWFGAIRVESCD